MPKKSIDKVRSDIISQIHTKLADEANYDLDIDEYEQKEKEKSYKRLLRIINNLPENVPDLLVEGIKREIEEDDLYSSQINYVVEEMVEPFKKINKISQGLPSDILSQFVEEAENDYPGDFSYWPDIIQGLIKGYKDFLNVLSSASAKSLPDEILSQIQTKAEAEFPEYFEERTVLIKELIKEYKKIVKRSQNIPSHILSQIQSKAEDIWPDDSLEQAKEMLELIKLHKESTEKTKINEELTDKIERLELMEEKFGITLKALYVSFEERHLVINGEIYATSGDKIDENIELVIAAYDDKGRVIEKVHHYCLIKDFFVFDIFSEKLYLKTIPRKIRIFPKKM